MAEKKRKRGRPKGSTNKPQVQAAVIPIIRQARVALERNRTQLAKELSSIERALASLAGIGTRAARRTVRGVRRKPKASPKQLAALKKARGARRRRRSVQPVPPSG